MQNILESGGVTALRKRVFLTYGGASGKNASNPVFEEGMKLRFSSLTGNKQVVRATGSGELASYRRWRNHFVRDDYFRDTADALCLVNLWISVLRSCDNLELAGQEAAQREVVDLRKKGLAHAAVINK
jgi:hypothetical protein